ncbi:MAG: Tex family protein [Verrucomicrobiota bacterium]|nr:Tex family protein [Verrucomicrobiota bacterium]
MVDAHISLIAIELNLPEARVRAVARLLAEGGTVPFIARYRKEQTGSLDEVAITTIRDRLDQLKELDARREAIIQSLMERNLLTEELKKQIAGAETLSRLEDLYLPYRPKRRTRAMIARERGLEPLATFILEQQGTASADPLAEAAKFVDPAKEVPSKEEAIAGARDIIAEMISDHADTRAKLREVYEKEGVLASEVIPGKEAAAAKYRDYFKWSEPVANAPSHRILAIRRGSQEEMLFFTIRPAEERAQGVVESLWVKAATPCAREVGEAARDSLKRLLGPSLETETRLSAKKRADADAVKVFADNLRELLLASPLGQKRVLALDPGFRSGCKLVVLDAQGNLIHDTVIYPEMGAGKAADAREILLDLAHRHAIEAIAIGNGTASRETERFVRAAGLPEKLPVLMVNESGASIYSASEVAREEFPDKDITVRGAVSIGRRLMDPLAELVKLDPKSIGVGQYQHDVDQRLLKQNLDDVVISSVNAVGVEVNTASRQLLSYVSGLNERIAGNVVEHRKKYGPFRSRKQLRDVDGLGPKTFELAAGFLRVRDGQHPLDASAVHPESYPVVEKMAADLGCDVRELMSNDTLRQRIKLENYVSETIGLPTLKDILQELAKPGRDPRRSFELFTFDESVQKVEDLRVGQKLPGIVTNVAAFGAFVDLGVHQDGLVHVSQVADRFVKNPADVLKVGQKVKVTVVAVDLERKRISLSLKTNPDFPGKPAGEGEAAPARKESPAPRNAGNFNGPRSNPGQPGPRKPNQPPPQRQSFGGDWFDQALTKGKK